MRITPSTVPARRKSTRLNKLQQINQINNRYSELLSTLCEAILSHSAPNETIGYLKQLSTNIQRQNAIYCEFKCPLLSELLISTGAQNVQCLISMTEQKKLENIALKKEYEEQTILAQQESTNSTLQDAIRTRKEELKRLEKEKQVLEGRVAQIKYQYGETKKELRNTQQENIRCEIVLRNVERN